MGDQLAPTVNPWVGNRVVNPKTNSHNAYLSSYTLITNTSGIYANIVKISGSNSSGDGLTGSGILIAPNLVLSANHVLNGSLAQTDGSTSETVTRGQWVEGAAGSPSDGDDAIRRLGRRPNTATARRRRRPLLKFEQLKFEQLPMRKLVCSNSADRIRRAVLGRDNRNVRVGLASLRKVA